MQKQWWEELTSFLCKFWWIFLLLLLAGLIIYFARDQWMPSNSNSLNNLSDLIVDQKDIQIIFTDNETEDGDLIRVLINGDVLLDNYELTNDGQSVPVYLDKSKNSVAITALNEGADSPNTVEVRVSNVIQGNAVQISSGMLTNETAEFVIKVK